MSSESIVQLQGINKTYHMGDSIVHALLNVNLDVQAGEYLAIMGTSGSGKSTMLNLLGCLDRPTEGRYLLGGDDVSQMDDDTVSAVRGKRIGFVFQSFNLIEQLTVLENIEVPLFYQQCTPAESEARGREMAIRVGLGDRLKHRPSELSGGQMQRVALARALANDPLVVLADEPTGNLDSVTETEVLDLMDEMNAEGKTMIVVTHDDSVSARAHRIIYLKDGEIDREVRR